jgi:transcriptional regulator with XRE-family HTH domain
VDKREASDLSRRVVAELKADQARRGWTLKDIQRGTGMAYRTLNRLFANERDMTIAELIKITDAVDLDAKTILDEADRQAPGGSLRNLVSQAADNVTALHETDWDTYEGRKAATNDEEASEDEPAGP